MTILFLDKEGRRKHGILHNTEAGGWLRQSNKNRNRNCRNGMSCSNNSSAVVSTNSPLAGLDFIFNREDGVKMAQEGGFDA